MSTRIEFRGYLTVPDDVSHERDAEGLVHVALEYGDKYQEFVTNLDFVEDFYQVDEEI